MKKIEQFNEQIKGKKVAILGLGVSNKPLVKYFTSLGCDVSIYNENELEYDNPYNAHIYIGKDSMSDLSGYDYIFRSPSILPTRESIQKARQEGDIITSIDGNELETMNDLREYIYSKSPNDIVNLQISRGKINKIISIALREKIR